jgi:SET and MYND domain-containing protein 4
MNISDELSRHVDLSFSRTALDAFLYFLDIFSHIKSMFVLFLPRCAMGENYFLFCQSVRAIVREKREKLIKKNSFPMADFFHVPGKKSSYLARKFLNAGNSKLAKGKFYDALESFNKCLCFAEPNSQESSLAYASRAKVHHQLGESLSADPWSFFQLSYPPNEKVPYIANCLHLQSDPNFGRFIVAAHDLKPGDVIAIEEPFFRIVDFAAGHVRCSNCLRSNNLDLVPSNLCASSKQSENVWRKSSQLLLPLPGMFCSQHCFDEAKRTFHEAEVKLRCIDFTQKILLEALSICEGSFDKLQAFIDDPKLGSKTVFDYDWHDASSAKSRLRGLTVFNSLQLGPLNEELAYIETHPVLELFDDEREKRVAKAFMSRIGRILTVNCYSLDWRTPKRADDEHALERASTMKVGSALLIFGSLFNHSCAPNIDRMVVDNRFVFIVRRPIRQGEQLFISYG